MAGAQESESPKAAFWKSVEQASKEVAKWPEWKRAGVIAPSGQPTPSGQQTQPQGEQSAVETQRD